MYDILQTVLTKNRVLKLLRSPKNSSMLVTLGSKVKYSPKFSYNFVMLLCMLDNFSYCSLALSAKL